MLARIHHRGPDDTGRVQLENAWLGHQRLSIMDVAGGKQPIADDTDSAYVVGNGEIYNHEDIRDVLSEVRFATDSDTESAFRLVLRDGSAALYELRGHVRVGDGPHRRARRGGPRPDRDQAAVLGAPGRDDDLRQ